MNLTPNTLTSMARRVLRHRRTWQKHSLIHPTRDWWIGLVLATVIIVCVSIWSVVMYLSYRTDALLTSVDQNQTVQKVYRAAMVVDALTVFEERAIAFASKSAVLQGEAPRRENDTETDPTPDDNTATSTSSTTTVAASSTPAVIATTTLPLMTTSPILPSEVAVPSSTIDVVSPDFSQ